VMVIDSFGLEADDMRLRLSEVYPHLRTTVTVARESQCAKSATKDAKEYLGRKRITWDAKEYPAR